MRMIQLGEADLVLAGGTEAAITPMAIGAFAVMRALSTRNEEPTKASRPFTLSRDGFVMGEGAGVLVLEEYEHARRRGAGSTPSSSALAGAPTPTTSPSPTPRAGGRLWPWKGL